MTFEQRIAIIEKLRYECRIAFIAFCAERCLKEARLHPVARKQLESLPQLVQALEILWSRAEGSQEPDPATLDRILVHLSSYDSSAPDGINVSYHYDVTLVDAANCLRNGLLKLKHPQTATPDLVVVAINCPYHSVSVIYADYRRIRNLELEVLDTALMRLLELGDKPFSRAIFDGIPEWERGPLSKKYAEGRLRGTSVGEDE